MKNYFLILLFCSACLKSNLHLSKSEESTVDFYNQKFNEYQRLNIDTAKLYIDSILIIITVFGIIRSESKSDFLGRQFDAEF